MKHTFLKLGISLLALAGVAEVAAERHYGTVGVVGVQHYELLLPPRRHCGHYGHTYYI